MRGSFLLAALLILCPAVPWAFEADLVPASRSPEARDIQGTIAISGSDGTVHVVVSNVNDAQGNPADGTVTLDMRVRDNGRRRHVTIPVDVSSGDGDMSDSLGLQDGDQLIVRDVRLRSTDHHVLAELGTVTAAETPAPTPPTAGQCPDALASCQSDLDDCNSSLDDCESGN